MTGVARYARVAPLGFLGFILVLTLKLLSSSSLLSTIVILVGDGRAVLFAIHPSDWELEEEGMHRWRNDQK